MTGIRDQERHSKPEREKLHNWAFAQLRAFLAYKARAAGVPFIVIGAAYTSRQCSNCGHTHKQNRTSQALFTCLRCGVSLNADTNAAINIARKGYTNWVAVNLPHAAAA